jgi:peptide/nickel transport system permease protein
LSIVEANSRARQGKRRANARAKAILGFAVTVITTFLGLMAVT